MQLFSISICVLFSKSNELYANVFIVIQITKNQTEL